MTEQNETASAPQSASATRTFGEIVWRQFSRHRPALFGMWVVGALFLLAVYAPAIACNIPFLWKDDAGVSFPIFLALFDRNIFESNVDVFFNAVALLLPLFLLGWLLLKRLRLAGSALSRRRYVLACALLSLVLTGVAVWANRQKPYRDWVREAGKDPSVTAVFPPIPHSYRGTRIELPTVGPFDGQTEAERGVFLLGTDTQGRDVFVRMLYGTRISLTIGVFAVAIYVTIGIILGAMAGYLGGKTDILISRMIEVMICFPSFFLILTIVAIIPNRSIFHIMLVIGVTSWTEVARLVRGEFLKQKALEYAIAARALGARPSKIMFRHILPNAIAPVFVSATFGVASAILVESGLSFLGLGDEKVPSWGHILTTGRETGKWWMIFPPGVAIFVTVSALNLMGEGLRDAIDPKLSD